MNPDLAELLCDPQTHAPLLLASGPDGQPQLVNPASRQVYPIRQGIPIFLDQADTTGQNRRYQRVYDRLAPLYDMTTQAYALVKSGGLKRRRMEYLRELEIKPDDRVLEVSVGTGANWQFLPATARYVGLDISWGMLRRCQSLVRRLRLRADLLQGAAEHLPFRDGVFDSVLHMGGINFFNDISQALREMIRVAKPGTKFVIVDETENLARRFEKTPAAGSFYGGRLRAIAPPADLVPGEMLEIAAREICEGELYCLTFRKP